MSITWSTIQSNRPHSDWSITNSTIIKPSIVLLECVLWSLYWQLKAPWSHTDCMFAVLLGWFPFDQQLIFDRKGTITLRDSSVCGLDWKPRSISWEREGTSGLLTVWLWQCPMCCSRPRGFYGWHSRCSHGCNGFAALFPEKTKTNKQSS